MQFTWRDLNDDYYNEINQWLSNNDRHNLCMQNKNWKQTALDINECLEIMPDAQFKNIIGFVDGKPVVALMFGIEQIKVLNLYNIVVNPKYREMGIAKEVISKLMNEDKGLNLSKPYLKVVISTLPDNIYMQKLLSGLGFDNLGFDGEYMVFEKEKVSIDDNERA